MMVWAEMMSMTSEREYKKQGVYLREDCESACGYAQELFNKYPKAYRIEIDEYGTWMDEGLYPADSDVYKKEHVEKCSYCGKEILVPKRKHSDWSGRCCEDCYDTDDDYYDSSDYYEW